MARSYTKFNSTRSKAEFARNALAGTAVASIATANLQNGLSDGGSGYPATGWAGATTRLNLNVGGTLYGDSSDWAATENNNIVLEAGKYQIEVRASVKMTTTGPGVFHYALTDDSYTVLYESTLSTGMTITNQNEIAVLSGYVEIELAAQTEVLFHIGVYSTEDGTLNRGPHSQLVIRKVE